MKDLLAMCGLAVAAYIVGLRAPKVAPAGPARSPDSKRRPALEVGALAGAGEDDPDFPATGLARRDQIDKRYTAFHYEALARQAADERRLAELEWRLTEIELSRHASRAVRCTSRRSATSGNRRHG